ncbi:hypothetical protein M8J77_012730 [Diaphorina citri]|nr:hypothetical protein M8J77_012730 [Diaphorina citri]
MTLNSHASDETLPCDLTSTQRMPVGTHMTGCVKYASMSKTPSKRNNQKNIKIATWNVRGLNEPGKLENVLNEMKHLEADVLGVSETFWDDSNDFNSTLPTGEKFRIIYSGGETRRRGVAIFLNQKVSNLVQSVYIISERVIAVKLESSPVSTFIIQCYAPTLDSDEDEKARFYDELRQVITHKSFQDVLILMGDFNAKVGDERVHNVVGPYGLGNINSAGEDLVNFCEENNLFVSNTWFDQKQSARHTWISPNGIYKNQIDYICVSNRFRNSITNAKARPGADCGSDHNPVVITMRIKLKKLAKKNFIKKWDVNRTKCPVTKAHFTFKVNEKVESMHSESYNKDDVELNWNNLKKAMTTSAEETIGTEKLKAKQKWMTLDILKLMEERKKLKNSEDSEDKIKYKQMKKEIQKLCRRTKDEFLNKECEEAERLETINSAKFHKKIKDLTTTTKKLSYCLLDANGNEIYDTAHMLSRWKEYCEKLYEDERSIPPNIEVNDDDIPVFTVEKIKEVIKTLATKKSCGSDNIPAELIKILDNDSLFLITDIINSIYKTGQIPNDYLLSTFITLPKVNKAKNCSQFRTISLISHASKILLQIIKQRINNIIEENLSETQMGFRAGKGCRDAITVMRILLEKNVEKNSDIYAAFIDYEKAFDNVNHQKLIDILIKIKLPTADIRLITHLYWGQKGKVKTNSGVSEEFNILKGVRQGCIISPALFNIYAEQIIKETVENVHQGLLLNGRLINNLRYADDLVLLSSSRNGLIDLLKNLFESSKKYNMKINIKKSKVMRISKNNKRKIPKIQIEGQALEEVSQYKYLGALITNDAKCDADIKTRIAIARNAFWKHKEIFRRNVSKKTKLRILQTYVFSILSYGCESWTLKADISKRITSFENWCYRRMLKISWRDRVTNCEILRRMGKSHFEWLNIIRERKLKFAGHVLRGSSGRLMLDVLEGDTDRARSRGRPRRMWFDNIKEWLNIQTMEECKILSQDRQQFRSTVNTALSNLATIDHDDATQ